MSDNNFFETNENQNNSYRKVQTYNKQKFSFGRSVVIPFFSGIVGTSLVLATCFGIPSVKETLIGNSSNIVSTPTAVTNSNYNNSSTTAIALSNYSDTAISVADKILPSIVGIKVEYTVTSVFSRYYGSTNGTTATAEGSGIIISEDGYILTNNHIVNTASTSSYYSVTEANKIIVTLYNDTTEYTGTIIGTDEQTDLAVIKIDKTGLSAAELANSDSVKVGEFAMAVGNPLGMQSSITCGVISAVNRTVTDSDGNIYFASNRCCNKFWK